MTALVEHLMWAQVCMYSTKADVVTCEMNGDVTYRILYSVKFRGSKFSRTAIFEIISRICCTRTLHAVCQKFSLKYFHERLKIHEIREIKDL